MINDREENFTNNLARVFEERTAKAIADKEAEAARKEKFTQVTKILREEFKDIEDFFESLPLLQIANEKTVTKQVEVQIPAEKHRFLCFTFGTKNAAYTTYEPVQEKTSETQELPYFKMCVEDGARLTIHNNRARSSTFWRLDWDMTEDGKAYIWRGWSTTNKDNAIDIDESFTNKTIPEIHAWICERVVQLLPENVLKQALPTYTISAPELK